MIGALTPSAAAANGSAGLVGRVGRIPVRNLWLLMFYASDLFRQAGVASIAIEEAPDDTAELVAEILAYAVEQRLRTPLTRGYEPDTAELSRVRGRIDLLASARRDTWSRGKVSCRFETLTINTPRNRLVRAALAAMARIVEDDSLRHRCSALERTLVQAGVGCEVPARASVAIGQFGRHDVADRLMVDAARLALELALPTEDAGVHRLLAPGRDEVWARRLFERAVGGFYERVLRAHGWSVNRGKPIHWPIERPTAGLEALLPSMKLDILLDHPESGRRIVIDTKFTSIVTSGWYREESFKSGYLYQLYAYLRSQERAGDEASERCEGILLHPSVDGEVDEMVEIQGHPMRFATVDLAGTPRGILARLEEVVGSAPTVRAALAE
ncbi:5-methylcytosine-specific restriction endonuclease system specificity protein McrC [Anaeromyxobacter oryzisoli]|uniref:5-methylcytosine-specific restriction endonuclease system specificity protein McrC n=1 Tax=Anaeromyxobacter oryzisoli TaxID=2925408 RepID=UPI001F56DDCF|nr:5-methylcytosine-specific restriction endonuclease system specificity protein McrC [Anaeromyxobacter sp. SG63]